MLRTSRYIGLGFRITHYKRKRWDQTAGDESYVTGEAIRQLGFHFQMDSWAIRKVKNKVDAFN